MAKYNPDEFKNKLTEKLINRKALPCPYCGMQKYTTTNDVASIIVGDDTSRITIGPHVPAGMLICENCGHIELFALGSLNMIV